MLKIILFFPFNPLTQINIPTNNNMSETVTMVADTSSRPKSKKELRAEKKAAKKKAATTCVNQISKQQPTEDEIKAEKHRLKKELRKERLKEREEEMIKEMRREKKLRQQKRKRRELHAVGGGLNPQQAAERLEERRNKKKQKRERNTTQDATSNEMAVFDRVFNGAGVEDEKGTRVLEMGVKATDVVIGKGQTVQNNSLVTVRYKLTGGKFGALIDSNNKFVFRVGKLEVIQGWDIGVLGMAVGGTRKLVVPPKAGYGSKDIGAGSGGLLHFDITVLSCT